MMKSLRNNLDIILILTLVAIPILLWLDMRPLTERLSSTSAVFRSLGQVTGLLGMALLSINFILTTRFRFLDKLFNGLNRVYVRHHLIGALAFSFLLFHPTFLVAQYILISLKAAYIFLISLDDWATNFGKLALIVFVTLMVITFYLNFRYQNWKNTHKYLGIVLLLGSTHMLLVPSDISNNTALKYYMLLLAILGGLSYLYRTIFRGYRRNEYKYRLEEVTHVTNNIAELKLAPLSRQFKFLPGQFVFIRFETPGMLSESHPFSITSACGGDQLTLGVKTLGDYTSILYLAKPGLICSIEGPFGAFSYAKAKSKRQIWVAGGIGITPFLSMAREINAHKEELGDYQIDLYYTTRNQTEAAFAAELEEISRQNTNFKFQHHFSENGSHISADSIVINSGNLADADVFLCGPASFMRSLREQFVNIGFSNNRIHSEEFSLSL